MQIYIQNVYIDICMYIYGSILAYDSSKAAHFLERKQNKKK